MSSRTQRRALKAAAVPAPDRRAAFGVTAFDWSARLAPALGLVVAELGTLFEATAAAVERRKCGEPFVGSLFMDDLQVLYCLTTVAPWLFSNALDFDERRHVLNGMASRSLMINGRPQNELESCSATDVRAAAAFLELADVVAVRSSVERERLCTVLGRRLRTCVVAPLDARVPARPSGPIMRGRSMVVWAPHLEAHACGLFAFALEEFRRPAFVVCAGGQPARMRAETRFVNAADGPAVLNDAAIIIDASLSDPGTARALARWGVPLATSSTTGALDWLDGIAVFDPLDHRSIETAVYNASGSYAARERFPEFDDAAALREALEWPASQRAR